MDETSSHIPAIYAGSRVGDLLQLSAFFISKSPRGLLTETHHQQGSIRNGMVSTLGNNPFQLLENNILYNLSYLNKN